MKETDKNIIMITAGGVGERFGANIPKQYIMLNGRPVISYVIEACKKSRLADSILVVSDSSYHDKLRMAYGVDVASSGSELNITKRNGFNYIQEHSDCQKIIVVDAVRPALETETLDLFFELLEDYDAVASARKITDSLGHYGEWIVNRADYYTLYAPEGFRFPLLNEHFRADSPYTESIQQLPDTSRVYLNFDMQYLDKITYPEDLARVESLLQWRERHR